MENEEVKIPIAVGDVAVELSRSESLRRRLEGDVGSFMPDPNPDNDEGVDDDAASSSTGSLSTSAVGAHMEVQNVSDDLNGHDDNTDVVADVPFANTRRGSKRKTPESKRFQLCQATESTRRCSAAQGC